MLKKEVLENESYKTMFIKKETNEEDKKDKDKEKEFKKVRQVNM